MRVPPITVMARCSGKLIMETGALARIGPTEAVNDRLVPLGMT
jgi:hypothetical protein